MIAEPFAMTINQANALISLIGNTRQVPVVQSAYSQPDRETGDMDRIIQVNWYKRHKGGLLLQGSSVYAWDPIEAAWKVK